MAAINIWKLICLRFCYRVLITGYHVLLNIFILDRDKANHKSVHLVQICNETEFVLNHTLTRKNWTSQPALYWTETDTACVVEFVH